MLIAIDKNSLSIERKKGNEYIYLFDNENLEDIMKKNIHCMNYKYCNFVDINLTDYEIECIKKAKITDKDYDKIQNKKDYKFVIIIPNYNNDHGEYNGKTFLRNSIESVLSQKYKNFHLIVVDDISDDTSVDTIKSYKDDRLILIQNTRKRYNGGSRNAGIEYALNNLDFDYFCFLDSDDWWKDNDVLEIINNRLYGHDLLTLGCEMLGTKGVTSVCKNEAREYEDLWSFTNRVWCTAWARVIKKEKIAYFCEDTLMEDRVWTYKIADNVDFKKTVNLKRICYVWNRMNTSNSVSLVRNYYWDASAYCHIGHQLQFLGNVKHKEMLPILEKRINECISKCNCGTYQQY
jgi:glycosyltransferase involved in cell wall biosynthesis